MDTKTLVLAATGTTGSETVRALLERGASVRAATRDPSKARLPDAVEVTAFSFDQPATWRPALTGIDALYFAVPPFRDDELQVGGAFLEAARDAGVRRVVKLSAAGADHMPEGAHHQLEQRIEQLGFEFVHLRPTFFMENFINFWGQGIAGDGVIALPAGQGATAFIAARDIGDVAAAALTGDQHGQVWELTGEQAFTHDQVAALLSAALDRPVQYLDIEPQKFRAMLGGFGMPELGVEVMSWLYDFVRGGGAAQTSPQVREVLGRPATRLQDWIPEQRGAWQA